MNLIPLETISKRKYVISISGNERSHDNLNWLKANGHPKWKTVDLNAPLKGWEQYDCVTKVVYPTKRRAPEKPRVVNPVLDAIKKMFTE